METSTKSPYPLPYSPVKRGWLDRHGRWKIPLGCLLVVVLIGIFVAVLFTVVELSFRKSDVYQEALARAERSPLVASRIGTPLQASRVAEGALNVSGSTGTAHMTIPIKGPRGTAAIQLEAQKLGRIWKFRILQVRFDDQSEPVNLLTTEAPTGPGGIQ